MSFKLKSGCKCVVCDLSCVDKIVKLSLQELGVKLGSEVIIKSIAPFGGPVLLSVNGQRLALRRDTLNKIEWGQV